MINMIISNLFALFILTHLSNVFLDFRFQKKYIQIIFFIVSILVMCTINFNGVTNQTAKIMLLFFIFYVFFQFKGELLNKIVVTIHTFIIFSISEICVSTALNTLGVISKQSDLSSAEYFVSLLLSNLIVFILVKLYTLGIKFFISSSLPKYSWLILVLPLSTIIMVVNIPNYYSLIESNITVFFILIGLFISNIVSVIIFINSVNVNNIKNELKLEKYKQKYSQTKYDLLDQQHRNNFNLLHSIMNKCSLLTQHIDAGNLSEISKELEEITDLTFKEFNSVYSNSVILNTLITNKLKVLEKNDIKIKSTIEYNDFEFMDFCDQIDLFSNLLDIAINETLNYQKHRVILIKSSFISDQLLVYFQFTNNPNSNLKNIITESIKTCIDKYNITVSTSLLPNQITSVILIFINNEIR